jgi:hypothetical protein
VYGRFKAVATAARRENRGRHMDASRQETLPDFCVRRTLHAVRTQLGTMRPATSGMGTTTSVVHSDVVTTRARATSGTNCATPEFVAGDVQPQLQEQRPVLTLQLGVPVTPWAQPFGSQGNL